jgi:hypothetical protein
MVASFCEDAGRDHFSIARLDVGRWNIVHQHRGFVRALGYSTDRAKLQRIPLFHRLPRELA